MLLKINPNRMELLRLKKRLIVAKRGYKLLKDKRDALIQVFVRLARENNETRKELEEELLKSYAIFLHIIESSLLSSSGYRLNPKMLLISNYRLQECGIFLIGL